MIILNSHVRFIDVSITTFLDVVIIFFVIVAIVLVLAFFACFFHSSKGAKEYWVEDTSLDDDFK